jgi:hypothetical protein
LDNFEGFCNGRCWYIPYPFGTLYCNLVYFKAILHIFWLLGIFFHVLVCCNKKNLATQVHIESGWPDWANFAPKVVGVLWTVFLITETAHIVGLLFPQLRVCTYFGKKGLGYILGDFTANSSGHPAFNTCRNNVQRRPTTPIILEVCFGVRALVFVRAYIKVKLKVRSLGGSRCNPSKQMHVSPKKQFQFWHFFYENGGAVMYKKWSNDYEWFREVRR